MNLNSILKLIPESKRCADTQIAGKPDVEIETDLEQLLSDPLDYPPLQQAILAEDTVCIVLEPGTPQGAAIAAKMASVVSKIGVAAECLSILLAEGTAADRVAELNHRLEALGLSEADVLVHDSTQRSSIGFLGPSSSGEPISLNARLVHADFVVPIACGKLSGWKSQIDFLYPYFSDVDAQKRFFQLNPRNRIALNEEATRWLGATFLVGRLPTFPEPGSSQPERPLLVGEQKSVRQTMSEAIQRSVTPSPLEEFDLVIAEINPHLCISNEELEVTIQQVVQWCSADGSILLVWNNELLIPRLIENQSSGSDTSWGELFELGSQSFFVLTEQPKLAGLGMASIGTTDEVERLIDQHEKILVLKDFHNEVTWHKPGSGPR
ncbi:MAG: lactate racemase domain-containing protein [Planctomycetota bacterium]|nr:lactate racemase domain-containing protein [Planctomycetota bacterium]